jgi:hypothetical protein
MKKKKKNSAQDKNAGLNQMESEIGVTRIGAQVESIDLVGPKFVQVSRPPNHWASNDCESNVPYIYIGMSSHCLPLFIGGAPLLYLDAHFLTSLPSSKSSFK